jgi:hypothetical protein
VYRDFGLELEVVHHTQLLNRLVREGRLTPVASGEGASRRSITYHDPCFLGRHNQVYSPPRELLQVLPGASYVEMERSAERSFCCGAGGARMWMEERIGERINENRTREAVATGADQIAVGCPFCRVMLDDGLTAAQSRGEARDEVEVLDVAQMLLASVKGVSATRATALAGAAPGPAAPPAAAETAAVPAESSPVAETAGAAPVVEPAGGSLFDDAASLFGDQESQPQATATTSEVEATRGAEGKTGGSLFGDGASLFDTPVEEETKFKEEPSAATEEKPTDSKAETRGLAGTGLGTTIPEGQSLFDVGEPEPASPPPFEPPLESPPEPDAEREGPGAPTRAPASAPGWQVGDDIPEGQSLFDVGEPAPAPAPVAPATAPDLDDQPAAAVGDGGQDWEVGDDIPEGQSLFDVGRVDPVALSESATAAASDEPAPEAEAEVEVEVEVEVEAASEPEPADKRAGEPRTDADINQAGSLFDL